MQYENAIEIFDYLPREAGGLARYVNHLWGAFEALMEKEDPVSAFAILPFHLLFMLSVQGKVYRISAFDQEQYLRTLGLCRLYGEEYRGTLENNSPIPDIHGTIPARCSVRNLSLLPEKQLFAFLNVIGADKATIDKAIELIEIRGTYAHANGNIEEDIEERIDIYLHILRIIQKGMNKLNDAIANQWISELSEEEDLKEFVENRLIASMLNPIDFRSGELTLFSLDEDTNIDDWKAAVSGALVRSPVQATLWLNYVANKHSEKERREYVAKILRQERKIDGNFP